VTEENGPYYLWWIQGTGPMPTEVLGVYDVPPPATMTSVSYTRVGSGMAARAAAWISARVNDAIEVTQLLPDWPGNQPP
jgi:hypothetical protein